MEGMVVGMAGMPRWQTTASTMSAVGRTLAEFRE